MDRLLILVYHLCNLVAEEDEADAKHHQHHLCCDEKIVLAWILRIWSSRNNEVGGCQSKENPDTSCDLSKQIKPLPPVQFHAPANQARTRLNEVIKDEDEDGKPDCLLHEEEKEINLFWEI